MEKVHVWNIVAVIGCTGWAGTDSDSDSDYLLLYYNMHSNLQQENKHEHDKFITYKQPYNPPPPPHPVSWGHLILSWPDSVVKRKLGDPSDTYCKTLNFREFRGFDKSASVYLFNDEKRRKHLTMRRGEIEI